LFGMVKDEKLFSKKIILPQMEEKNFDLKKIGS